MGTEDAYRFSRLHQHRFIIFKECKRLNQRIEGFPISCSFSGATVDN